MRKFDKILNRRGTNSNKWDELEKVFGMTDPETLPMWVADMDFQPPIEVNDAIIDAVRHGIHGYFGDDNAYKKAITGWMARRHNWHIGPETIFSTHGIVAGLAICIRAFSDPGDGVIIFPPVYHAFDRIIRANDRVVVESPLELHGTHYQMNLDDLESRLNGSEKIMLICSPHNPVGRIWTEEELQQIADFCEKHNLVLLCDEIHHDLILPDQSHTVMPLAVPGCANRLVMLTAGSKTFNLAGALTGNVIISDEKLRAQFATKHRATGSSLNRLGVIMMTAAYTHGDRWVDELCLYLEENYKILRNGLNAIPGIKVMPMQATYLAWVNLKGTGMDGGEIADRFQNRAKIAPSYGPNFGTGGDGFVRLNIAMPRKHIQLAVERLTKAFDDLQ